MKKIIHFIVLSSYLGFFLPSANAFIQSGAEPGSFHALLQPEAFCGAKLTAARSSDEKTRLTIQDSSGVLVRQPAEETLFDPGSSSTRIMLAFLSFESGPTGQIPLRPPRGS